MGIEENVFGRIGFCCLSQDKIYLAEPENFSAQYRLQSLNCSRTKH